MLALTTFFAVPKGALDIWMVYDGTVLGLNDALWIPWFTLPTVESHLQIVEPGTFMADVDSGEMFLNFFLDKHVRKYAGVRSGGSIVLDTRATLLIEGGGSYHRSSRKAANL